MDDPATSREHMFADGDLARAASASADRRAIVPACRRRMARRLRDRERLVVGPPQWPDAGGVALHYASPMAAATLIMWFSLRSPDLAEDFERLMASDRDVVRSGLESVADWRLTRPTDVPGQASESADYVLIAEIVNVERFQ